MHTPHRTWFTLTRFDDDPPGEPTATDGDAGEGEPTATGGEPAAREATLGDAGKQAIDRMKAERNAAKRELAKAQERLVEYEDRDKTEAERVAAARDAAEQRAAQALARAVKAEVKALAADAFADPDDAASAVDPAAYISADGEVDTDGIKTRLAELLDAKPHWRKAASAPPKPKPDPGQGARGEPGTVDYRTADKATFEAKLAEYGLRPRS